MIDSLLCFTFSIVLISMFAVGYYTDPLHDIRNISHRTCTLRNAII